jgi:hypothetical protein
MFLVHDFLSWARAHRQRERKARKEIIHGSDALPVKQQCEILNLSRFGIYYTPVSNSAKDMAEV